MVSFDNYSVRKLGAERTLRALKLFHEFYSVEDLTDYIELSFLTTIKNNTVTSDYKL